LVEEDAALRRLIGPARSATGWRHRLTSWTVTLRDDPPDVPVTVRV
jgi:hypothetical protein